MNRIIRRAGTLLAALAVTAAGSTALAPGAHADHPFTFCNNTQPPPPALVHNVTTIPGGLGVVTVHLAQTQDSYVSLDADGTAFDTLIGIDLGAPSPTEAIQFCFLLPIVGNNSILITLSPLSVELCSWSGPAGHPGGTFNCVPIA